MSSPLSAFMKNLRIENNATDCEIVCDNAKVENPIKSLNDSMSSLESINFSLSPVLEARDERKEMKKKSRWVEDLAYTASPDAIRKLPQGRIFRRVSDDVSQQAHICRQRPPSCPKRQISNESVGSLGEYQLAFLSIQQANQVKVTQCSAASQSILPDIPNRRPSRIPSFVASY
jgi:hypothetical protein